MPGLAQLSPATSLLHPQQTIRLPRTGTSTTNTMPRDLEHEKMDSPAQITESPNSVATERSDSPGNSEEGSPSTQRQNQFVIIPADQQFQGTGRLHPYTRPLTIYDIDSCVALENAAFKDPRDRATREKVCQVNIPLQSCARDSISSCHPMAA